ncbi:zf-HC2 domain-containing protein [Acidobacteria bacterium AH-259-L09]|nr:zf-HC2 domain-containing protein [Acidobacteria bacterium AH-259-L09]
MEIRDCNEVRIQISALLDGNVEVEEVEQVQRHLASCSSCTEFYQEQLELARWLKAADFQLEPPAQIWRSIESRIGAKPEGRTFEVGRLLELFGAVDFRYAVVSLVVLILCSLALLNVSTMPQGNQRILAELESYRLEVNGNPFLPQIRPENPFFRFDRKTDENPFHAFGSLQ